MLSQGSDTMAHKGGEGTGFWSTMRRDVEPRMQKSRSTRGYVALELFPGYGPELCTSRFDLAEKSRIMSDVATP